MSALEILFADSRGKIKRDQIWKFGRTSLRLQSDFFDSSFKDLSGYDFNFLEFDSDIYPAKLRVNLKNSAPPVLTWKGNAELLKRRSIGFCGARNASEQGIAAAGAIAEEAVSSGLVVVSGNARGVDEVAHGSALREGGATIFVLPEGIEKGRIRKNHSLFLNNQNHMIVSEFFPSDVWLAKRAMQRNRTIVGLSDALVVVEAGETGGTLNAGLAALELGVPLFVVNYQSPSESAKGNRMLIERGGVPLKRVADTGRPNVAKILQSIDNSTGRGN